MMEFKPIDEPRSVGITFDSAVLDILDQRAIEAAGEDGVPLSRSDLVRRLVMMGLDLLRRDDPVLARYTESTL